MVAQQTVEFAGLVATHGPSLVLAARSISEAGLTDYWKTSKSRLDSWGYALRRYRREAAFLGRNWAVSEWHQLAPTIEDIFLSEILVRTWTAVIAAYDRRRERMEAEAIANSVYLGHMEIRHRLLSLIAHGPHGNEEQVKDANALRRRAERWADMLVARIVPMADVSEFAVDPSRATDFAENLRTGRGPASDHVAWELSMASLRAAFPRKKIFFSANAAAANEQIATAILACFPAELFDGTGVPQSLWMTRIEHAASDTQGMIAELLAIDDSRCLSASRFRRTLE